MRRGPAAALAALLAALALAACSTGPSTPSGEASPARLPGVSDRTGAGAQCVGDLQSCDKGETCCSGLSCAPHGRFGMLCRRPAVGGY